MKNGIEMAILFGTAVGDILSPSTTLRFRYHNPILSSFYATKSQALGSNNPLLADFLQN